jgi:hypothetical protein
MAVVEVFHNGISEGLSDNGLIKDHMAVESHSELLLAAGIEIANSFPHMKTRGPIMCGHNIVVTLHGFFVPLHNSTLHVMYPLCRLHEIQIFPKKPQKI